MLYLLWAFTVAGGVLYQGAMKKVGTHANALLFLVHAYLIAAAVSASAYFVMPLFFGNAPGLARSAPAPSWKLALSVASGIFLLELGNALALGSNKIDLSLFVPMVWGAIVLIVSVMGWLIFSESMSPAKAVGITLVVAGIVLIQFGK